MTSHRISPQSGTALILHAGQFLTLTDPDGEQVCDLIAFDLEDKRHWLSSGRTIDYANSIYLSTNDVLYSNRSQEMLSIVADDVGRHDFLLTPCSPETFEMLYDHATADHPTCFGNLVESLADYGIKPDDIPTTFNVFMNVEIAKNGQLAILPPRSRAGDSITFKAHMDLIIGLTACSAEKSNNYSFGPIDFWVSSEPPQPENKDDLA